MNHIQPRSGFQSHSHRDVEIVTYEEGNGLAATDADQLDLRFEGHSEMLLFDVRMDVPLLWQ